MQTEDLRASAAIAADELHENAAGTHANADDADMGRDWRVVQSFQGQDDTGHVGRQSA
jgi:hypothetical protein